MNNKRITASMIVKNEEEVLRDCLKSIKGLDDIVIIDTGSTDKTIEIAKQYTDKVYSGPEYEWKQNFAYHRNQSLSKCDLNDWILIIDADEVLEDNGVQKIKEFIKDLPEGVLAVNFNTISSTNLNAKNRNIRLFKNNGDIKWEGPAHNYLTVKDNIVESDITIYYGYSPSHMNDPNRTFRILKNFIKENPNAIRERYYLAREYYYRKDCDSALNLFDEYLKLTNNPAEAADAYMLSAYCFYNTSRFLEARECCLKAILINADFKEPFLLMSKISGSNFNNQKWLEFSKLCNNEGVLFNRTNIDNTLVENKFENEDENENENEYKEELIMLEKKKDYYNKLFEGGYNTNRYYRIYEKISDYVKDSVCLDMGCGVGSLSNYIKNYIGFDFSEVGIEESIKNTWNRTAKFFIGDIYDKKLYEEYKYKIDVYICLEVLEHLEKDREVIKNIPSGKPFIFSVPSFHDPSHVRVFNEEYLKNRYYDLIEIKEIVRFNWQVGVGWSHNTEDTNDYILLVFSKKK